MAVLLTPACADHKGPPFHLQIAHKSQGGRCVPVGAPPIQDPTLSDGSVNITQVRVSAVVHAPNDSRGTFTCDKVFPVGGNPSF
ncbi:MAG TPA: hypothetical protein VFF06_29775, partial [Polyangia bacterium]|nr:hypothetical protein [Polyangia bacterium]